MKTIVYCEGREESEEEIKILNEWGQIEIDPSYNFPTWEGEIKTLKELIRLGVKLGSTSFKTYLPGVNGDEPIVAFFLEKKKEKE